MSVTIRPRDPDTIGHRYHEGRDDRSLVYKPSGSKNWIGYRKGAFMGHGFRTWREAYDYARGDDA